MFAEQERAMSTWIGERMSEWAEAQNDLRRNRAEPERIHFVTAPSNFHG